MKKKRADFLRSALLPVLGDFVVIF